MKVNAEDKKIGKRLRSLREAKGVKQKFIAKKLKISKSHLCELEAGKKRWFASVVAQYEKLVKA